MIHNLVFPDATRPETLLEEITALLVQLPFILRIYIFGSLTTTSWDQWSDIDLIVVIQAQKHTWDVWNAIHEAKPILYHYPLSHSEPNGLHLLGNVFQDESVFHCLDLNLLTIYEHDRPGAMERFGPLRELHHHPILTAEPPNIPPDTQLLTVQEERIAIAIHFTKKHIKRVLRGEPVHDDLSKWVEHLRTIIGEFSFDYEVVGGKIGKVAKTYLQIAGLVLGGK